MGRLNHYIFLKPAVRSENKEEGAQRNRARVRHAQFKQYAPLPKTSVDQKDSAETVRKSWLKNRDFRSKLRLWLLGQVMGGLPGVRR